jgi:hypothetical protein
VFYLNKDIIMIKNRTKFVLTVGVGLSLFSGLSQAMFLKKGAYDRALLIPNPSAPARLGALALIHDDEQRFSVLRENGEINEIPNHLVAKDLRGISQDEVKARLDNNINFRVQQGSDGEFSLQEGGGLDGGSWLAAKLCYAGTKAFLYATLIGTTVAVSTVTAPAAVVAVTHAAVHTAAHVGAGTALITAIETASVTAAILCGGITGGPAVL